MAKNDKRTRIERRADPERWFHVTELGDRVISPVSTTEVMKIIEFDRKVNIEAQDLHIQGPIDEIIVVSLPKEFFQHGIAEQMIEGVRKVLSDSGITGREIVAVPKEVRLMKLRPVSREVGKGLTKNKRIRERRVIKEQAVKAGKVGDAAN
jgi:hypothetical protein